MLNLIKLEVKKTKVRTYTIATIVICMTLLAFAYLFAYAPQIEPNDPDLAIFEGYRNVFLLLSIFSMGIFATLSAVMYSKIIIEEYKGKKVILLLSYPTHREKILVAKLFFVFGFVILGMLLSNLTVFSLFSLTETFTPIVNDTLTLDVIINALKLTIILSIVAGTSGIVATGIGFVKRSVPVTIISALLLSSLISNILANIDTNYPFLFVIISIISAVTVAASLFLIYQVKGLEVE